MTKDGLSTKKQLFEEEEEDTPMLDAPELKINEQFAKKFEHNKRRQLLEQAKEKYGEKALDGSEEASSSEDDDDDAALVNSKFEKKFIETITMIRDNDPKLKDADVQIFKESDFEDDDSQDNS